MKLSVTTWSFPKLNLDEIAGLARVLGIEAIDLGYFYDGTLDKQRVLDDPRGYGEELAARLPVRVANLYHLFGSDLHERNLSLPPNPQNFRDARCAIEFASAVGADSVFFLPGMINPDQSRDEAITASANALKPIVEEGQDAGIVITVEPHVHGVLESPADTLKLLERAPGLRLTLDPAHFIALGYVQREIEQLIPYAGHVHLRQARQGCLQSKMELGTINFPAFFAALRDAGYDGWMSAEYVHQSYMDTLYDDVLTETVKMRDCLNAWRGANRQ